AMRTLVLVPVLLLLLGACHGQQPEQRKNYVVHLEPRDDEGSAAVPVEDWHRSFLPEAAPTSAGDGGADAGPRIIYSYSHVLTGFAARLSDAEAEALRGRAGCIRLYPEVFLPLATTHSPGFLGLQTGKDGFWSRSGFGRGVVIGLVDTGILPSHPSFGDAGMPPPPKKWKGACEFKAIAGAGGCNNKVIGARAFGSAAVNDTAPPVDDAGHGTHTASTAAGNFVENADVCSRSRCSIMDVIAGLDAAVKDGVDVISMSIDVSDGAQFNYDLVAVATYKAIERGIFVSAAAGNAGPAAGSVSNCAPWILTVAAGTTDRAIRTTVKLGNGQEFDGESLFQPHNNSAGRPLPLVFPGASGDPDARGCSSLPDSVSGKVVLCESRGFKEHVEQGQTVKAYSGAGMILMNKPEEGYTTFANAHVLPASHVSNTAGSKITAYFKSTPNPTASITFKGTVLGISPAPTVAFFSSRGPSKASPGILKPDISGPGMNILAAWAPSEMHPEFVDDVSLAFFMESGTSMSTPHLSGIAAVIKSLHPSWSPAAIKSALMTSSDPADKAGVPVKDEQYRRASFFTMGAGYVNPSRAVDPGLVYDLSPNDYIPYLCGLGYGDDGVKEIVHRRVDCAKLKPITEAELNYPSLVVKLLSQPITVRRTVKNVGKANSVYTAVVDMPKEVSVTVRPPMLRFSKVDERQSFTVTVRWAGKQPAVAGAEGNLKWVSPEHVVRSPIVVPPAKVVV
uniref:Subtilisin-like protease n=1 Tax=Aegilops tauschii subsp. strangulata TaxID=200361 RepID=A0A453J6V8_AEGTS